MRREKFSKIITYIVFALSGLLLTGCGNKPGEYTLAAIDQIQNQEYDVAFASLDEAVNRNENPMHIARVRGIASLYSTQYEEAVTYLLDSLSYSDTKVDEMDYDINYYLAAAYEKLGDYSSALNTYSAIIALKGNDYRAHYLRGCDYLATGDHDNGLADFNRALDINNNNYDLRIDIAGMLSNYGYEEEGVQFLKDFLVEKEKRLSSYDKGRIYYFMGDYETARTFLEEARDDDDQDTILYLGRTYEKLGDYNYATSVYLAFLNRHPDSAVIQNQLGMGRIVTKDYKGALEAFQAAKNIPNNGMEQIIAFNEIVGCEYSGDFQKAKSLMSTYLQKYPDDEAAKREQIFLSTR